MIASVCLCCGADIRLDEPIMIDDFSMFGDGYPLAYKGKPLRISPHESSVCWTLMKVYPMHIGRDALLNRIGSEEAEANVLQVYICRIRAKLRAQGIPDPIETIRYKGFRWRSAGEMADGVVVEKAA